MPPSSYAASVCASVTSPSTSSTSAAWVQGSACTIESTDRTAPGRVVAAVHPEPERLLPAGRRARRAVVAERAAGLEEDGVEEVLERAAHVAEVGRSCRAGSRPRPARRRAVASSAGLTTTSTPSIASSFAPATTASVSARTESVGEWCTTSEPGPWCQARTAWPTDLLELLGSDLPVVAAPMSGGPTTPALVLAAVRGGLGWLAGRRLQDGPRRWPTRSTRCGRRTDHYGVNLFSPNPEPVDPAAYAAYRELLLPLAATYGVELPATPVEDDDGWRDKVDVLVEAAPPVVSFTFGLPEPSRGDGSGSAGCTARPDRDLGRRGACSREQAGMDALIVQSPDAGGHWGTFTPARPAERLRLPDLVRAVRRSPTCRSWPSAGSATSADVAAALRAGAQAVAVGTLLLLADEAGTNPAHRAGFDRGPRRPGHDQRVLRPPGERAAQRLPRGVRRPRPAGLPGPAPPHQPDPQGGGGAGQPRARQPLGRRRPPQRQRSDRPARS